MPLSREEITQIAKSSAQAVLEGLHRYTVAYEEPETIEQGLQDSMVEERTAADWYRKREEDAAFRGDSDTATVYGLISLDEDRHYDELNARLQALAQQEKLTPAPEVAYDASLEAFRKASREFTAIRNAYRAKEIGDEEYLREKATFDKASQEADIAEEAYIKAKAIPKDKVPDVTPAPEITRTPSALFAARDFHLLTRIDFLKESEDSTIKEGFVWDKEAGLKLADGLHKGTIRNAIAEGVAVPAEVLADYPDLARS